MDALLHRFDRHMTLMNYVSHCVSVILHWLDRQMTNMWNPCKTSARGVREGILVRQIVLFSSSLLSLPTE